MNKSILYIGNIIDRISSGADMVNQSNLSVITDIFKDQFFSVGLGEPNFYEKFCLYTGGCTKRICDDILNVIQKESISIVFLSSSLLGKLAKQIKKSFPRIVIISFCHNIERVYAKEEVKVSGIRKIPSFLTMSYNEYLTIKYSDKIIVLNQRDNALLNKYYKRIADLICPIVCEDKYKTLGVKTINDTKFVTLFVGTAFFANVEGIKWYIDNVKPYTDDLLIIVGKGMDKYQTIWEKDNIKVYGFVDDLSIYYNNADAVILPIFHGGGMKTKTAEAFMYGKLVVGSTEAFQGYDNLKESFAIRCNDAESFISTINQLSKNTNFEKFNKESRAYYLNNNTYQSHYKRFKSLFDTII